jgi:chemotaxis response regulator CheB
MILDFLKGDPGIEVIGEHTAFAQTLKLASKLQPEVILLDVHMGDEHAVTSSQVSSGLTESRLLAMSIWNDDETKAVAVSYGAVACLDKTKLANQLFLR